MHLFFIFTFCDIIINIYRNIYTEVYIYIYIYCDVAVPTRVHPPRESSGGASRAAAPEKDFESRIEISGETSNYLFALVLILFFLYNFCTSGNLPENHRRKRNHYDSRYDNAGGTESRVAFVPCK